MEREIIEKISANIPLSPLKPGYEATDEEIWEENDGNAHFKMTRHLLPGFNQIEILSLALSGDVRDRLRIVGEFSEVFGDPVVKDTSFEPARMDTVLWRVDT